MSEQSYIFPDERDVKTEPKLSDVRFVYLMETIRFYRAYKAGRSIRLCYGLELRGIGQPHFLMSLLCKQPGKKINFIKSRISCFFVFLSEYVLF